MGGCLSLSKEKQKEKKKKTQRRRRRSTTTAKVINTINGSVNEYPVPVSVSNVLVSVDEKLIFLCDSDVLSYGDYIPPMSSHTLLLPNHLYFLLPSSSLHSRLSPSDMAALAVKATLALDNSSSHDTNNTRNNNSRISPLFFNTSTSTNTIHQQQEWDWEYSHMMTITNNFVSNHSPPPPPPTLNSPSKLPLPSFTLHLLATIYEDGSSLFT